MFVHVPGVPRCVCDSEDGELPPAGRVGGGALAGRTDIPPLAVLRHQRPGLPPDVRGARYARPTTLRHRHRRHLHFLFLQIITDRKRRGKSFMLPVSLLVLLGTAFFRTVYMFLI